MATLSELAKTQQTTTVGQAQGGAVGSAGGTSIQTAKQIDKSAGLAKDIGKMFGGLLQEHQQASEYAGIRVGTDNLVEYRKEMGRISELYNKSDITSSEMVEKNREEQGVYEKYLQKGYFTDNDLASQAFRDTYADPAAMDLLKTKEKNLTQYKNLFKKEETQKVKSEMDNTRGVFNLANIRGWQDRVSKVGIDPTVIWEEAAKQLNYGFAMDFKDGISSPKLKLYLTDKGKLSQEGVDKLYNDYMGAFSTRNNGTFTRTYSDMPSSSHEKITKSFKGWLSKINLETPTSVKQTVSITNKSIKPTDNSEAIGTKLVASNKQIVDLHSIINKKSTKAVLTQYENAMQSYQEMIIKYNQSLTYESVFNSFIAGNYEQLSDTAYTYDVYSNSDLSKTPAGGTIKAFDMASYLGENLLSTYNEGITNGDYSKSSSALYALGRLELQGHKTKEASFMSSVIKNPEKFMLQVDKTNNIAQLRSVLDSTVGYKTLTQQDAPHLTKAIIDNTLNYYTEQKKMLDAGAKDENGKDLTETSILSNTKMFYRLESRRTTSALKENQRLAAGRILGLTKSQALGDYMDTYVKGEIFDYKTGVSVFGDGTLNSMLSGCIENGSSDRSSLKSCMKSKSVIFDPSNTPFFSTSLVLNNPTTLTESKFRNNVTDLLKYNVGQYQSFKNIKLDDVVDEKNISFHQQRVYLSSSNTNEVITTIHIRDNGGNIMHSVLLSPEDIEAGVPASEKERFSAKFKEDDTSEKRQKLRRGGGRQW